MCIEMIESTFLGQKRAIGAASVTLGVLLFILNNISVLSGWLQPPAGYESTGMLRAPDVAQYFTWIGGFKHAFLIPNYHAPWVTEPALFNPLLFALARGAALCHVPDRIAYLALSLALHITAMVGLFAAIREFVGVRRRFHVFAILLIGVPIKALMAIPAIWIPALRKDDAGLPQLFWAASDGFFNGTSGSMLVTFGTGATIWTFTLLARYLRMGSRRHFAYACVLTFVTSIDHPFEVIVICIAGTLVLVLSQKSVLDVLILSAAGVLGVLPYVILPSGSEWLHEVTLAMRVAPPSPLSLLKIVGLPASFALLLLVTQPKMATVTDKLLQLWFVATFVGIYLPWVPVWQHLLDGFQYGIALLLVRQFEQKWPRLLQVRLLTAGFAIVILLGFGARARLWARAWDAGRSTNPAWMFNSVASKNELALIEWMRRNAEPKDLVLSPPEIAPWLATIPMHSFGSHYLFSMTFNEQVREAKLFYAGDLEPVTAASLLADYGIKWVVIPRGSTAERYVSQFRMAMIDDSLFVVYDTGLTLSTRPPSIAVGRKTAVLWSGSYNREPERLQ